MNRTARLLNAQAVNLDVVDVRSVFSTQMISCANFYLIVRYLFCPLDPRRLRHSQVIQLVPPDWPVSAMSSFLTRSFRRTLHASHEGQIIKAISSGQNLEVRFFHSGPAVCSSTFYSICVPASVHRAIPCGFHVSVEYIFQSSQAFGELQLPSSTSGVIDSPTWSNLVILILGVCSHSRYSCAFVVDHMLFPHQLYFPMLCLLQI